MGYGVPTSGVQGFNEDSGTHYRAGNAAVCAGSAGFSVLLAFECMELGGLYANIGNIDTGGSPSGWFSERFPDVGNKPLYTWRITTSGGPIGFSYPLGSGSFIFGRTVLLAMTVDDEAEELAAFWNGAPIGATAYDTPGDTYVPAAGVARFQLGNASQLTANGTTDRLISAAYTDTVLTQANMLAIWQNFRQTSSLRVAGQAAGVPFGNSYEVSDISAPPQRLPPTTWPNGGTVAGGDLTWQSVDPNALLSFTVDRDPDFSICNAEPA